MRVRTGCRRDVFHSQRRDDGYHDFIQWTELTNPEKGFVQDDAIILEADITIDKPSEDPMVLAERIYELEKLVFIAQDTCKKCHQPDNPELTMLCDSCEYAWHTYCLTPPLKHIPEGD